MTSLPYPPTAVPKPRAAFVEFWPRVLDVLVAAVAWLRAPPQPPGLPDYLRQDIGLLPEQLRTTEPIRRHPIELTALNGWRG